MKKFLCVLLALTSVCCLAACEDGKCDECGSDKNVKVYEELEGEYCPTCAIEKGAHDIIDGIFGD